MARPRSDIAPRIVEAARARFLAEGVHGASLRAIARDAHTSIGMIYYYYPTKEDLLMAVVEEPYSRLLADLERCLAPDAPFQRRLERLYARVGQVTADELAVVRVVAREALTSSEWLARLLDRFQRGHVALVQRFLADGLTEGALDTRQHPAVLLLATMGMGVLPQLVRRVGADRQPFASAPAGEELARVLAQALLTGIGRPPALEPPTPGTEP